MQTSCRGGAVTGLSHGRRPQSSLTSSYCSVQSMSAARGMLYEQHVLRVWSHLVNGAQSSTSSGSIAVRVGGAHDRGVDILAELGKVQFLIQCKNLARPISPSVVREMEASCSDFQASRSLPADSFIIGVIASAQGPSSHAIQRSQSSDAPIVQAHIALNEPLPRALAFNSVSAALLGDRLVTVPATADDYAAACAAMAASPMEGDPDWAALGAISDHAAAPSLVKLLARVVPFPGSDSRW